MRHDRQLRAIRRLWPSDRTACIQRDTHPTLTSICELETERFVVYEILHSMNHFAYRGYSKCPIYMKAFKNTVDSDRMERKISKTVP